MVVGVSFYAIFFLEKIVVPRFVGESSCGRVQETGDDVKDIEASFAEGKASSEKTESFENDSVHDSEREGESHGFRSTAFVGGVIQILALSAHSLFESMVLGLSGEFTTVLNIFIATAAHRWLTAMAISFKLARTLRYWPFLFLLSLFSTMVPIGIGVGAALTSLSAQAQGVLFAISTGALLYIGAFESMTEEFVEHKKWIEWKFLSTLAGAGIIVAATGILVALDIHG